MDSGGGPNVLDRSPILAGKAQVQNRTWQVRTLASRGGNAALAPGLSPPPHTPGGSRGGSWRQLRWGARGRLLACRQASRWLWDYGAKTGASFGASAIDGARAIVHWRHFGARSVAPEP